MNGGDWIARAALHEVGLKLQLARRSANARAHALIRHGNKHGTNFERGSDLRRGLSETGALTQTLGPIQVSGQIQIAELKPDVGAYPSKRLQTSEAVAANAPTVLRVRQTGQRIGDGIEVGRDVKTVNLSVIGGVADDEDALRLNYAGQSIEETRSAHSAGEC